MVAFAGAIAEPNKYVSGAQRTTSVPRTRHMLELCTFPFRRGWIAAYVHLPGSRYIRVTYRFRHGSNIIRRFNVISRPGHRMFCSIAHLKHLCRKHNANSYYVLSTGSGLISSEEALSKHIGGELLMQILYQRRPAPIPQLWPGTYRL